MTRENPDRIEIIRTHWSVQEIADYLRVSDRTIRRWIEDGTLRGMRFGGVYRIADADLREFIKAACARALKEV